MEKVRNCQRCSKEFSYILEKAKFCKKCRSKTLKSICKTCSKEFFHNTCKPGTFCSKECTNFATRQAICLFCKKDFTYKQKVHLGKYCNITCKQKGSKLTEEEKYQKIKRYFDANVIKKEGCWEWKGAVASSGYGMIGAGRKFKINAHRASWLIHKGPIPKNLHVLHTCDNRLCNSPIHLFLGTPKDNMQDCLKKGRMRGHFLKGSVPHNKKNK